MKKSIFFLLVMLLFTYSFCQTSSENKRLTNYNNYSYSLADNNSLSFNVSQKNRIATSAFTKGDDETAEKVDKKIFDFEGGFGAGYHFSYYAPATFDKMFMLNGNFTYWFNNFAPRFDFNLMLGDNKAGVMLFPFSLMGQYRFKPDKPIFEIIYPYIGAGAIYDYILYDKYNKNASGLGITTTLGVKAKSCFLEARWSLIRTKLFAPVVSNYYTYYDPNISYKYNIGGFSVVVGFRL